MKKGGEKIKIVYNDENGDLKMEKKRKVIDIEKDIMISEKGSIFVKSLE